MRGRYQKTVNHRIVGQVRKVRHRRELSSEFVYSDIGERERCQSQSCVWLAQTFNFITKLAMKLCFEVDVDIEVYVWPDAGSVGNCICCKSGRLLSFCT